MPKPSGQKWPAGQGSYGPPPPAEAVPTVRSLFRYPGVDRERRQADFVVDVTLAGIIRAAKSLAAVTCSFWQPSGDARVPRPPPGVLGHIG